MKRRYIKSTVLDFIDRHADLLPIVVMLAVLIGSGVVLTGWPG